MRIPLTMLVFTLIAALPTLARGQAQDLDCGKHLKTAHSAIDKVTEDMKGMEKMPKEQVGSVMTLVGEAKKLAEEARQTCDKPKNDYDRARAIAKAEAARGSAEAADILHWHFMKTMSGMKEMKSSSDKSGMDMSGTKK